MRKKNQHNIFDIELKKDSGLNSVILRDVWKIFEVKINPDLMVQF